MQPSTVRNAYTLLNFGSWANGGSGENPYIQLLPTTNSAEARNDFITARMGGTDSTNAPQFALLPASQQQHSPVSEEEKKEMYQELVLSRWPYILVGCLVFIFLVVGFCIWRCCCRKGARGCCGIGGKKAPKASRVSKMFNPMEPASTTYLPLQEPGTPTTGKSGYPSGQYSHSDSTYSLHEQGGYPPPPGVPQQSQSNLEYSQHSQHPDQYTSNAEYYNAAAPYQQEPKAYPSGNHPPPYNYGYAQ